VCKDENAWVEAANHWLKSRLAKFKSQKRVVRLFLPAGETPRPLYRSWEAGHGPFLKRSSDASPNTTDVHVQLVQVDDIISGTGQGVFRRFFEEALPSFKNQFQCIGLAEAAADLAILGLGTNGHVAFHEPNLPPHFYSGCVTLDNETTSRLKLAAGARAVTYGLSAFMRCQEILLIVRGENKKNILAEILKADCKKPAAFLKNHPRLTILTDFALG